MLAQLLERLGFTSAQLSTPVRDLSGGQKRRLQLLLILLDEPNVLVLDEPTNDLDTDMLAAMEDLLDSWPGTLLVVSHDRYLLERITDTQYAIVDGHLRHLPGGVDQYLTLRRETSARTETPTAPAPAPATDALTGAERHSARKGLGAAERRMSTLEQRITALEAEMADHDPTDHVGLGRLGQQVAEARAEQAEAEETWLELSELLSP